MVDLTEAHLWQLRATLLKKKWPVSKVFLEQQEILPKEEGKEEVKIITFEKYFARIAELEVPEMTPDQKRSVLMVLGARLNGHIKDFILLEDIKYFMTNLNLE